MKKTLAQLIATIRYESNLLENSSLIRIPKYMHKKIINIKKNCEDKEEIIDKINFILKKIPENYSRECLARRIYDSFRFECIDIDVDIDRDIDEFIEYLGDESIYYTETNLFELNRSNLEEQVRSRVEKLSSREQEIIFYYFGFKDEKKYTLEKIGKIFGLTNERIRQIKNKAVKKLRGSEELRELYEI